MSTEDTGAALEGEPALTAVETVDTTFLETLIGYNARRTALVAIESFFARAGAAAAQAGGIFGTLSH